MEVFNLFHNVERELSMCDLATPSGALVVWSSDFLVTLLKMYSLMEGHIESGHCDVGLLK